MKFADKLFLATTAVLTAVFSVFGIFMVSSYFQNVLNRESERADTQSRMFQYLFEMAYQSMEEFGGEYALKKAISSVPGSVEKEGCFCFVVDEEENFLYGEELGREQEFLAAYKSVAEKVDGKGTYAFGIRPMRGGYYLLNLCESQAGEESIYLGVCMDLTAIYRDRQLLLNRYRFALIALVIVGGGLIYLLSRYMTRPIRRLSAVAGRIEAGDYELRARDFGKDEIGELAGSFNSMADRLVEQMKEKELEARQKEDFTAAFAHELKTPLTSIIGYADMLNSVSMSEEEKREAYFYIYSQGKRLESLSHKLLELVNMEKHKIRLVPVPARALEENLKTAMRPVFAAKKIRGKITLEKGIIFGDSELLLSLLYNLLDNAVKAVEQEGVILLKGSVLPAGYEIKVVDNGRGIPEKEIHRITEAFYMVDKSRSRKAGGAGIGMTLVKKILMLHSGTMKIDSKPGEGTVIKILFPKEAPL